MFFIFRNILQYLAFFDSFFAKVGSYFAILGTKFQDVIDRQPAFLAVLSGDYFVVLPDCTSSTYNSTLPGGSRQTPCTNPKLRAKKSWNWLGVKWGGKFLFFCVFFDFLSFLTA